MNEKQQAAYDFAMARVEPGKEEELKGVLAGHFKLIDEMKNSGGGFDRERMRESGQKISALLTVEGAKEYAEWREARRREHRGQ